MSNTSYIAFTGTEELRGIATQMDEAESIPLFYKTEEGEMQEVETTIGVFNKTQGYLIGTASDRYSILQNAEVLTNLADSFEQLNITPIGQVCNDYDRVAVEVHFPELAIEEAQHNKPIYMGAKFMNSYNKSSTFKGFGFMHRTWCSNGAYVRYALGEMSFSFAHIGDLAENAPTVIGDYVHKLDAASQIITPLLATAQDKKVMFDDMSQIVASLGVWMGSKRAGKEVYQHLIREVPEDEFDISRYDLWNAYTSYVSHTSGMSESVRNRISEVAEAVLNPRVKLIPVESEEQEAEAALVAA